MALGESRAKMNTAQPGNVWPWQRRGEKSSLPCKWSKYDVEEGINPGPKVSFLQ